MKSLKPIVWALIITFISSIPPCTAQETFIITNEATVSYKELAKKLRIAYDRQSELLDSIENDETLSGSEKLKLLSECEKNERISKGESGMFGSLAAIVVVAYCANLLNGWDRLTIPLIYIVGIFPPAILGLASINSLYFKKTLREKQYGESLKLNTSEREAYARKALLNQDPIASANSGEAYRREMTEKIMWVQKEAVEPIYEFLAFSDYYPGKIKILSDSYVYLDLQAINPKGYVFMDEIYRIEKEEQTKAGKWYGIKITPDHVIYNFN